MSSQMVTIALDAMGGDRAPYAVIEAVISSCKKNSNLRCIVYGDSRKINALLPANSPILKQIEIRHTDQVISDSDKPSAVLRGSKSSSMRLAIEAVKDAEADAMVSAGNTGALMAISKIVLRTLPLIDRPAIIGILPTTSGRCAMLDLGANAECSSENLLQFAVMGCAFSRAALGVNNPTVGLLNIGSEDVKGNDVVKAAAQLMRDSTMLTNFVGYIEGTDIATGKVDVVVTDGFSGNIALKTAEGTAKLCRHVLKEGLSSSLLARIGALDWDCGQKPWLSGCACFHQRYRCGILIGTRKDKCPNQ